MEQKLSTRARSLEMSGIRKMFDAPAPPGSINLGLGEPDFNPPRVVQEALFEAVRTGGTHNKYGPSAGIPALRDALAERYRRYDPRTSRDNVIVTCGGTEALLSAALALYDPGNEVLIPNPGFVLYGPHARMADAVPVPYSLREENGFQPDLDELEEIVTDRTRAIVVNSPSNPTGGVFTPRSIDGIVSFAQEHDLTILSDEVYDEIVYTPGGHRSFWGRYDRVVVVNSFSKILAMTGWRLGYLVASAEVAVEANKIHYHMVACPSTPCQVAALRGLTDARDEIAAMAKEFRARRDLIVRGLNSVPGMHCVKPEGAFYAFPSYTWGMPSLEAAQTLLQRGLRCTHGEAFGSLGESHLRFSFANSRENIRKAMTILRTFGEEESNGRRPERVAGTA
ncbi:MAG: aminotransferase class I/II-fold pyridoxal phosphate-dependent enzyme [Euryarchaeota archaeon]|nr:aminotransferase class I/II-fold pyridoxal phosphate-dependent enzyme [Euryarchaeota archaeon]MDE1835768.1 aminotransferase class I/II-fold pyridoxal phosphate-dependent enzyme [Euryarchaeota archaeon]MDE1881528.1 aminotransferase class I/II-fold pyridoxal phosphate-dependent enzyme [Euryarchaeota archaeon]MDE2043959.1 aminotransferase class I/II-fold pyridoxal phosphate-dependent enzyme [Thermoplasmata archaeon]